MSVSKKRDSAQLSRNAHNLKGAGSNMGALVLQKLFYQIEIAAKTSDFNKAALLLTRFKQQFQRFCTVYKMAPFKPGGHQAL